LPSATLMSARTRKGDSAAAADLAAQMLNALPHPVILVDGRGYVVAANDEAQTFFQASAAVLARHTVEQLVPFGSPLITLIDQVRQRGASVNEYRVDIGSPRIG